MTPLSRRTVLQNLGATAFATIPAYRRLFAAVPGKDTAPTRYLVLHTPAGTVPDFWRPVGGERDFTLSTILEPYAPLREDLVILDGVDIKRDYNCPGDNHGPALIQMMTGGVTVRSPQHAFPVNTRPSVDQLVAALPAFRTGVPYASLQVGVDQSSSVSFAEYHRVLTYPEAMSPVFPEYEPANLYQRLFASFRVDGSAADPLGRLREKRSVLDFVAKDMARLMRVVPTMQREGLEAHFTGVREIELKVTQAIDGETRQCRVPPDLAGSPVLSGGTFRERGELQLRMIALAFECDLTRVATFMWSPSTSHLSFQDEIAGIGSVPHHLMTHDGDVRGVAAINRWYSERYAAFAQLLKSIPSGNGTLLDHTLITVLSDIGDHTHGIANVPLLLLGKAGGRLSGGRCLRLGGRSTNDVHLSVLRAFGSDAESFGDTDKCGGAVEGLMS